MLTPSSQEDHMAIVNQHAPTTSKRFTKLCFVLALSSLVYACGGGAGDDEIIPQSNDAAIAAVAPVVGVWNLPPGTHLAAGRYIGVGKGYRLRFQSGDVDHRHRLCRDRTHPRDVDVVLSV